MTLNKNPAIGYYGKRVLDKRVPDIKIRLFMQKSLSRLSLPKALG
jgi:hypothetical protein